MAPIARFAFAVAHAPITLSALCCTLGCLPTRDLQEYGPGSGAVDAAGVEDPGTGTAAAGAGGSGTGASNGESLPTNPPLDPTGTSGSAGGGNGALGSTQDPEGTDAGATLSDAAGSAPCATGELLGPNGQCYFFDVRATTWDLARSACGARGAGWDLASVRTAADSTFIGQALEFEAWIGASDTATEGTWVWAADGRAFWVGTGANGSAVGGAYTNWNSTEPNGGDTTNCARALPSSFGSPVPDAPWADLPCTMPLGAICEAFPVAP